MQSVLLFSALYAKCPYHAVFDMQSRGPCMQRGRRAGTEGGLAGTAGGLGGSVGRGAGVGRGGTGLAEGRD